MKKNEETPHTLLVGPATDFEETKENGNSNTSLELQKEEVLPIHTVSIANIADLDKAEVVDVELSCDYWKPEGGEIKRVLFDKIDVTQVLSINDPTKIIDLECAFFFVKEGDTAKRICNGSKRLVGALQSANVKHGMALEIVYQGKVKNRNNGFSSDTWSVKPLVIKK